MKHKRTHKLLSVLLALCMVLSLFSGTALAATDGEDSGQPGIEAGIDPGTGDPGTGDLGTGDLGTGDLEAGDLGNADPAPAVDQDKIDVVQALIDGLLDMEDPAEIQTRLDEIDAAMAELTEDELAELDLTDYEDMKAFLETLGTEDAPVELTAASRIYVNDIMLNATRYLKQNRDIQATEITDETPPGEYVAYYDGETLYLKGAELNTVYMYNGVIHAESDLKVVVTGSTPSKITLENANNDIGSGIHNYGTLDLTVESNATLEITCPSAAILTGGNLTITNSGTLTLQTRNGGSSTRDGIYMRNSSATVTINNTGTLAITDSYYGIRGGSKVEIVNGTSAETTINGSDYGIYGSKDITITNNNLADGSVTITATKKHAVYAADGDIKITGPITASTTSTTNGAAALGVGDHTNSNTSGTQQVNSIFIHNPTEKKTYDTKTYDMEQVLKVQNGETLDSLGTAETVFGMKALEDERTYRYNSNSYTTGGMNSAGKAFKVTYTDTTAFPLYVNGAHVAAPSSGTSVEITGLGSGSATFEATTGTLTLNGATISKSATRHQDVTGIPGFTSTSSNANKDDYIAITAPIYAGFDLNLVLSGTNTITDGSAPPVTKFGDDQFNAGYSGYKDGWKRNDRYVGIYVDNGGHYNSSGYTYTFDESGDAISVDDYDMGSLSVSGPGSLSVTLADVAKDGDTPATVSMTAGIVATGNVSVTGGAKLNLDPGDNYDVRSSISNWLHAALVSYGIGALGTEGISISGSGTEVAVTMGRIYSHSDWGTEYSFGLYAAAFHANMGNEDDHRESTPEYYDVNIKESAEVTIDTDVSATDGGTDYRFGIQCGNLTVTDATLSVTANGGDDVCGICATFYVKENDNNYILGGGDITFTSAKVEVTANGGSVAKGIQCDDILSITDCSGASNKVDVTANSGGTNCTGIEADGFVTWYEANAGAGGGVNSLADVEAVNAFILNNSTLTVSYNGRAYGTMTTGDTGANYSLGIYLPIGGFKATDSTVTVNGTTGHRAIMTIGATITDTKLDVTGSDYGLVSYDDVTIDNTTNSKLVTMTTKLAPIQMVCGTLVYNGPTLYDDAQGKLSTSSTNPTGTWRSLSGDRAYTFAGWYTGKNGTGATTDDGDSLDIMFAKWKSGDKTVYTYTLDFTDPYLVSGDNHTFDRGTNAITLTDILIDTYDGVGLRLPKSTYSGGGGMPRSGDGNSTVTLNGENVIKHGGYFDLYYVSELAYNGGLYCQAHLNRYETAGILLDGYSAAALTGGNGVSLTINGTDQTPNSYGVYNAYRGNLVFDSLKLTAKGCDITDPRYSVNSIGLYNYADGSVRFLSSEVIVDGADVTDATPGDTVSVNTGALCGGTFYAGAGSASVSYYDGRSFTPYDTDAAKASTLKLNTTYGNVGGTSGGTRYASSVNSFGAYSCNLYVMDGSKVTARGGKIYGKSSLTSSGIGCDYPDYSGSTVYVCDSTGETGTELTTYTAQVDAEHSSGVTARTYALNGTLYNYQGTVTATAANVSAKSDPWSATAESYGIYNVYSYGSADITVTGGNIESSSGTNNCTNTSNSYGIKNDLYLYGGDVDATAGDIDATDNYASNNSSTITTMSCGVGHVRTAQTGSLDATGGTVVRKDMGAYYSSYSNPVAHILAISCGVGDLKTETPAGGECTVVVNAIGKRATCTDTYTGTSTSNAVIFEAYSCGIYSNKSNPAVELNGGMVTATGAAANASAVAQDKRSSIAVSAGVYVVDSSGKIAVNGGTLDADGKTATATGSTTETLSAGIYTNCTSAESIKVTGGEVYADGSDFGMATASTKTDAISVTAGKVDATASAGTGMVGNVTMTAGDVTAIGTTYGLNGTLKIDNGTVTATASDGTGLKGNVTMKNGDVTATGTTIGLDGNLTMTGGKLTTTGATTGLNGNLNIIGGYLYSHGKIDGTSYITAGGAYSGNVATVENVSEGTNGILTGSGNLGEADLTQMDTNKPIYIHFIPTIIFNSNSVGEDGRGVQSDRVVAGKVADQAVTYDLNATNMQGVPANENELTWVDAEGNAITAPEGVTGAFTGTYPNYTLTLTVTKPTPAGTYYFTVSREGQVDIRTGTLTVEETLTVTYDLNGGTSDPIEPTQGLFTDGSSTVETAPDPAPTREGYTFLGWTTDRAGTTAWVFGESGTGTKVTADTTLYAKWKGDGYRVTGIVNKKDAGGNSAPESGVTVKAVRGNEVVATADNVTDVSGEYVFASLPAGIYNFVATKSGKTMTALVEVKSDMSVEDIVLPYENVNSTLVVKPGETSGIPTPNVMVGGLDDEAVHEAVNGSAVTIGMTVEQKSDSVAPNAVDIKAVAVTEKHYSEENIVYLDIGLTKKVDSTTTDYLKTENLLKIIVPFVTSDKHNFMVFRYHDSDGAGGEDGVVDTLTTSPNAEGEKIEVGNNTITIYAKKFSTYAIAYTPGAASTGGVSSYAITLPASTPNGTVTSSHRNAYKGVTVTITATPDEGYTLEKLTVTDKNGKEIALTDKGNGKYTFSMPASKVTVSASFVKETTGGWADCAKENTCPISAFSDAKTTAWYHDAVHYCLDNGIMNGVGGDKFAPTGDLSRAMLMTMLARLDGVDTTGGATWYEKGVAWAMSEGVSDGTNVEGSITREQIAAMLYRYAGNKGYEVSVGEDTNLLSYTDALETSEWAISAMQWAVGAGVLQGKGGGVLDPTGTATRAEVAQMFMNFCQKVVK